MAIRAVLFDIGGPLTFPERARRLRPGVMDLLRAVHARGVLLGLAANQPADIVDWLDSQGAGPLFSHREVSGHHGFRKPDARLFLRACENLGVEPSECVMVGDELLTDIVPAKLLGMTTILFRTGAVEQPAPVAAEWPDIEVSSVSELQAALIGVLDA